MSNNASSNTHHSVIDDAWDGVVGSFHWLKSVLFGEFEDNRPLSAIIADMLVSFIPAVVIATSARDAVAVILRMAKHPEKREEVMEWVLLCACLITIALPLAMAGAGLAAAGVGAVVGGIAGSELGAALRAVMLLLVKASTKLVEMIQFLQKFIKGDILKFLKAIKFAKYEKALIGALKQFTTKLIEITRGLIKHLESLPSIQYTRNAVAKLTAWEKAFYGVQSAAIKNVPKALAELDARLTKVLAEVLSKETHVVPAGVKAKKPLVVVPAKQEVRDVPGRILRDPAAKPATPKPDPASKVPPKTPDEKSPRKDKPEEPQPADDGKNTKKQDVVDPKVAADAEHIKQLSEDAAAAEKRGDLVTRDAKINEAREILRPHVESGDVKAVVDRLDVSTPPNGAYFWSGNKGYAKDIATKNGGSVLESTAGGRILDQPPPWDEINKNFPYNGKGSPGYELWGSVSEKYAQSASGEVHVVQAEYCYGKGGLIWNDFEKDALAKMQSDGKVVVIDPPIKAPNPIR